MSILTGPAIEAVVRRTRDDKAHCRLGVMPWINVEPFDPAMCGPNSYDVHLGPTLLRYDTRHGHYIDPDHPPAATPLAAVVGLDRLPRWYLKPGVLYLGATAERVECHGVVPWIDGRSSVGRLGISVHVTAGRGDDGWPGPRRGPAPVHAGNHRRSPDDSAAGDAAGAAHVHDD